MSRVAEYVLVTVIGLSMVFLVVEPMVHRVTDQMNSASACIQSQGADCAG